MEVFIFFCELVLILICAPRPQRTQLLGSIEIIPGTILRGKIFSITGSVRYISAEEHLREYKNKNFPRFSNFVVLLNPKNNLVLK